MLSKVINYLHKFFVYFMFLGFLLPKKFLYIHFIIYPLLLVHWKLNKNKCMLTQLEFKYKNEKLPPNGEYPFIKHMINEFNIYPTNKQIKIFFNLGLYIAWLITIYRLFIHNKQ